MHARGVSQHIVIKKNSEDYVHKNAKQVDLPTHWPAANPISARKKGRGYTEFRRPALPGIQL